LLSGQGSLISGSAQSVENLSAKVNSLSLKKSVVSGGSMMSIESLNGVSQEQGQREEEAAQILCGNKVLSIEIKLSDMVVERTLGQGAGGYVEKAIHTPTRTPIAVKVIQLQSNYLVKKQILTELQTLHECQSEHIVKSYGAFIKDGLVHICLEFMDRGSLASVLHDLAQPFPEVYCGLIAAQILQGLNYLHKTKKVIHRDIKPSNILLNSAGEVKISDFGVSGKLEGTYDCRNTYVGTLTYMSPERFEGKDYGSDTDLWSLGILLYELATGEFPYPHVDDQGREVGFFDLLKFIIHNPSP